MSRISELLEQIATAVYGQEVRSAIHDSIQECYDDVVEGSSLANAAAISANAAAANANTKATLANEKATLAEENAALADAAATSANAAATLANSKATLADSAATSANTAATLANTKANLANEKAALADEKAALADQKATLATNAATSANTAADSASTAATNANTKANAANTAAASANAAATSATNAATNANTKASLADEAATNANTKASLANTKAALADTKATLADQKATLATNAANAATAKLADMDEALSAASAATTAAQNAVATLDTRIRAKQNAPAEMGTSGQVLGLDANLAPIWVDQSGGGGGGEGTTDHRMLSHRNDANQHEMTAIKDLTDTLTTMDSAIASKGTYTKPVGGIPSTDMASAVQNALTAATTAVQPSYLSAVATSNNYNDLDNLPTIPSAYDDTAVKNRLATIEGKESGWDAKQSAISDLDTIRSGAALGSTALQSVPSTYRTAAQQDAIHDNTKLDISQGTSHAGDFLVVGSDGKITTKTMEEWEWGEY